MAKHLDSTALDAAKADARERALRTLYQSLGVDVLVGVGVVTLDWVGGAAITSGAAWATLGVLVGKSALTSVASYLTRLKVAPTAA